MRRILFCLLVLFVAFPALAQRETLTTFGAGTLTIESANGKHNFNIEVARTPDQHRQGLMFRQKLAPDAGMLFINESEQPISMWMSNTLIPLDMLFIAADGKVVRIAERAVPRSEEIISSGRPVLLVLEVNGGIASKLGIKPGDTVTYTEGRR